MHNHVTTNLEYPFSSCISRSYSLKTNSEPMKTKYESDGIAFNPAESWSCSTDSGTKNFAENIIFWIESKKPTHNENKKN